MDGLIYLTCSSEIGAGNGALRTLTIEPLVRLEFKRQFFGFGANIVWADLPTEPEFD